MDYKEKYEQSLERAKKLYEQGTITESLNYVFPELKESEDEKIRKVLHELFSNIGKKDWKGIPNGKIVAWLEKQGTPAKLSEEEQNRFAKGVLSSCAMSFINYLDAHKYEGKMCVSNGECENIENAFHNAMWDVLHRYYCKYIEKQGEKPQGKTALEAINEEKVDNANNVKPKFKTGDWICNGRGNPCKVNYIFCNYYELCSTEGYEYNKPIRDIDANYHLWSIEDAKDGDALYSSKHNLLWIYKNKEECHVAVNLNYANSTSFGTDIAIPSDVFPATKEQRDTLERAIINAGYEWDAKKKELKKIKEITEE